MFGSIIVIMCYFHSPSTERKWIQELHGDEGRDKMTPSCHDDDSSGMKFRPHDDGLVNDVSLGLDSLVCMVWFQ